MGKDHEGQGAVLYRPCVQFESNLSPGTGLLPLRDRVSREGRCPEAGEGKQQYGCAKRKAQSVAR